ncbi:hypothetical protein LCGC14_2590230 [marine sediment metagenome]|uniref:Uncharacterized protein n=1 Tax=marine sediment metagenome TaxID=412755 RepID=A0A0F9D4L2_9ZZZZ
MTNPRYAMVTCPKCEHTFEQPDVVEIRKCPYAEMECPPDCLGCTIYLDSMSDPAGIPQG